MGTSLPDGTNGVWFGPFFGKTDDHIVVVADRGFYETTDGCQTWNHVAKLPPGYDLKWIWRGASWDPVRDIFYVFNVGKQLMRLQR